MQQLTAEQQLVIDKLVVQLKAAFDGESTGHDWFHLERVWKNAQHLCRLEGGNLYITELAALLHDIADHKFVADAEATAEQRIEALLAPLGVEEPVIREVIEIVNNSSYKGGIENKMILQEGFIVQDADRLDAIGAIGIARTFAFGGKFGNMIYHPDIAPATFKTAEEYRTNRTHTINHFYEKLLLLKDKMNTASGKKLAEERHRFMESFLTQFYKEWDGNG